MRKSKSISTFRKLIIGLIITLTIFLGSVFYSYTTGRTLYRSIDWVEHTYQINRIRESIILELSHMESAVRGYVISSNNSFINEYNSSKHLMYNEISDLKGLVKGSNQEKNIEALEELINKRMSILEATIQLKNTEGNYQQMLRNITNEGKLYMDKIIALKSTIESDEQKLLFERQNKAFLNLENTSLTILIAAITSIITLLIVILIIRRDMIQRDKLESELKELNVSKNRFFSIISHDLRSPVHGIVQLASFLKDENKTTREESILMGKMIEESALRLSSLLENLLQWTKSQMEQIERNYEDFNIKEVVNFSVLPLANLAAIKNIKIDVSISSCNVHADKGMIETVIRNLISNAIKFSGKESVIKVFSQIKENMLELSVMDSGVGISEDRLNKLFLIEYASSTKGTFNEKGSGLGLLLCKEFVEKNGGKISVKSKQDEGSTFTITIPLAKG